MVTAPTRILMERSVCMRSQKYLIVNSRSVLSRRPENKSSAPTEFQKNMGKQQLCNIKRHHRTVVVN